MGPAARRLDPDRLDHGDLRHGPRLDEFWLVWIAVDVVGVPLLFQAGYYPSAVLYLVYGALLRRRLRGLAAQPFARRRPAEAEPARAEVSA